jgi:tetratricopeptide (TPR) repeat protein
MAPARQTARPLLRPTLLGCAATLGLLALLATVLPSRDHRVVAVSRLGNGVRLLPPRVAFSFLPLERRLALPRQGTSTLLHIPTQLPLAGGAAVRATLRLELAGYGPLPVAAGRVRALGWEGAWAEWLGPLHLDGRETHRALAATALWRAIFPDDPPLSPPDLGPELRPRVAPLEVVDAQLLVAEGEEVVRAAASQELARRLGSRGRLIVLGLDALDWPFVDELVARGVMPHLAALLPQSAHATLEVPQPLISPVVWTTIATGVSPEVHGVLDFLEPDPAGGPPRPVSAASRKAVAIWEMAAAAGRSTATIGWWASFPAEAPPRGSVYSDRLTEQLLGLSAAVPKLADPPEAEARAHRLAVKATEVTADMVAPLASLSSEELAAVRRGATSWDDPIGGLAKLVAATVTIERLTDEELARRTDLVLSYLEGTDTVGHLFAPLMPPPLPGVDADLARRFGRVPERYFAQVDGWIGRTVEQMRPEDRLVIVSDHGFAWGRRRPHLPSGAHTATAVLWHEPEGAFLAYGRGIEPSRTRRRLQILDVAPALLALAGLPPAAEMPGTKPAWLPADAPRGRVSYAALLPRRAPATVELPPEAREEELAKLRALGYLAGSSSPTPVPAQAPMGGATAPTPAFDRVEARRLNNLGSSRGQAGDVRGAEEAFRRAINADPSYAPAHYNLALLLRKQGRYDEADREFWLAVETGVRERELAVVQSALDYAARGETARAKATFAEGLRRFPNSATIWLNAGVFLGQLGEGKEATTCLERAVALDPNNAKAHSNLATALYQAGDVEGARRHLARAVALEPDNQELRAQLAALGGPPPS